MSDDPNRGKGNHYIYVFFFNYQVHFFYVLINKGNRIPQNSSSSSSSSASAFAAWSAQRAVSNFRGP